MTQIHCEYLDCDNNDSGLCQAPAVRLTPKDGCLNYLPPLNSQVGVNREEGDRLTWDQEYIEDDPMDDDYSA